ncbi:MAG: hypothetical protein ABW073_09645 [Acidimicrobiia bacterium]
MKLPRSKVERLARNLRNLSLLLVVVWLVAAGAAIAWVQNEFQGEADFWRYVTAVADVSTFLIASVLAYVGSAVVQAIGRVRSSIISAMFEQSARSERTLIDEREREQSVGW